MPPQTSRSGPTPRGPNPSLGGHSVSSPYHDEVVPEDDGRYRGPQRTPWTGFEGVLYNGLLPQQQVNNVPVRSGPGGPPPAPPSHASHTRGTHRAYDICRQYNPQRRVDSVTAPYGPDYQPRTPQLYMPHLQNSQRGHDTSQGYTAQQPVSPTTRPEPSRPQLGIYPHDSRSRAGQLFVAPPHVYPSHRSHDEQKRSGTPVDPAERLGFDSAQLRALANFERSMSSSEAVTTVRAMKDLACSSGLAREVSKLVKAGMPYDTAIAHAHSITQRRTQPAVTKHRPSQVFVADDEDGGDSEDSDDEEEDDEEDDEEEDDEEEDDEEESDEEEDDEEEDDDEDDDDEDDDDEDVNHSQGAEAVSREQEEVLAPISDDSQPDISSDVDKTHGDQYTNDNDVNGDRSIEPPSEGDATDNADKTNATEEDDVPDLDEASDVDEGIDGRESSFEESDEAESDGNDGGAQDDEVTIEHGRDEEDRVFDDEASMIHAMGRLDLGAGSSNGPHTIAHPETGDETDKPTFQSAGLVADSGARWHDESPSRIRQNIVDYSTHHAYSAPPTNTQALQPHDPPLDTVADVSDTGLFHSFSDVAADLFPTTGWLQVNDSTGMGFESNAADTQRAMVPSHITSRDSVTADGPQYLAGSSVSQRSHSMLRSDAQVWPEAVEFKQQQRAEVLAERKSLFQVFNDTVGAESLTQDPCSEEGHACFVAGCSITKQHISLLLRHCESQHSFSYCTICCMGFKSKQNKKAHQCKPSCIHSDCMFVKLISETDNPRKYRHEKTPDCPTATRGTVETQHRLDYLKNLFLSVFPGGSSHTSLTGPKTIRRQRGTKSTNGKTTNGCCSHAESLERHKLERSLLLKGFSCYMKRKGLVPDILRPLHSAAPELLQELLQKSASDGVSEMRGSTTQPGTAINALPGRSTSTTLVEIGNTPRQIRNAEVATSHVDQSMPSQVQAWTIQHDTRVGGDPNHPINPFNPYTTLDDNTLNAWANYNIMASSWNIPVPPTEAPSLMPSLKSGKQTSYRQKQPSMTSSQRKFSPPAWPSMLDRSQQQAGATLDCTNASEYHDHPRQPGSALNHCKQLHEEYGFPACSSEAQVYPGAIHHATQADSTMHLSQAPDVTYDKVRSTDSIAVGPNVDQQSLVHNSTVPRGNSGRVGLRGHHPVSYYPGVPGLSMMLEVPPIPAPPEVGMLSQNDETKETHAHVDGEMAQSAGVSNEAPFASLDSGEYSELSDVQKEQIEALMLEWQKNGSLPQG